MQKIINVLAVLSFVGVSGIVGGGAYVYLNREALAEQARERVTKAVTEAVAGALPGMLDAAMPEMPDVTGGALPAPADVGGGAPAVTGPAMPF